MSVALVDNDVLYKASMYGLLSKVFESKPMGAIEFFALGAARFMVRRKLLRRPPARGGETAVEQFDALSDILGSVEPSEEETALAADLEYTALQNGHSLDGGESQLCAILVMRAGQRLFTGDKRAIIAISGLLTVAPCEYLSGRVVCLEQLFSHLLDFIDPGELRAAVCSEPSADTALANCFACRSDAPSREVFEEGLNSYIRSLNGQAPAALCPD